MSIPNNYANPKYPAFGYLKSSGMLPFQLCGSWGVWAVRWRVAGCRLPMVTRSMVKHLKQEII